MWNEVGFECIGSVDAPLFDLVGEAYRLDFRGLFEVCVSITSQALSMNLMLSRFTNSRGSHV